MAGSFMGDVRIAGISAEFSLRYTGDTELHLRYEIVNGRPSLSGTPGAFRNTRLW
jgi:hypothetical protein